MTATSSRSRAALFFVLVATVALLAPTRGGAAEPVGVAGGIVPGEVVARFAPLGAGARLSALREVDARGGRSLAGLPGTRTVELPPGESVARALSELRDEPGIRWAEPNYLVELAALPGDPLLDDLWGLRNFGQSVLGEAGEPGIDVGAAEAWNTTTGSENVRVAIVDSGIDPEHPDLVGNLDTELSRNFVPNAESGADASDWGDGNRHGTHVAGTVAAEGDNDLGVVGVNWRSDLVAVRACMGSGVCDSAAVAEGLAYAGAIGARVANASLSSRFRSSAMEAAIAAHPETLYVVAAGNEGVDVDAAPRYPCSFPEENLVCVAAIGPTGSLASFSNRGGGAVDLGAPGVAIESTVPKFARQYPREFFGSPGERWAYNPEGEAIEFDGEPELPAQSLLTTANAVDLGEGRDCRLAYELALDTTEGRQVLYTEASDGEAWFPIQARAGGLSGSTGGRYVPLGDELRRFDGDPEVFLRFRLAVAADARDEEAVVALRGLTVSCAVDQPEAGTYGYLQGTSMASPHVAGVAALGWSAHPEASVAEMRDALLGSAVPTPSLAGATAAGGRVDAAALLEALEPEPELPSPEPEAVLRPGWALTLPGARRVPVTARGRALVRLRCRAARIRHCAGRMVLVGIARTRRGDRRMVLGVRRYALGAGRRALRPIWLRPRPAWLLRAGRLGRVALRVATRQPADADPRIKVRATRIALRPPHRRQPAAPV